MPLRQQYARNLFSLLRQASVIVKEEPDRAFGLTRFLYVNRNCSRYLAIAPIQADTVARISFMASRSFRPERAGTWKE